MPQDGSNNYQYPPGTPGVSDQTIESEAYNTFINDLVTNDLNIPRPIHRGGTNATTADLALTNLGAEKGNQIVTNYDAHVWWSGSFSSAPGAISAPANDYFHGFSTVAAGGSTVLVEARGFGSGKKFIRQKLSGVWGAWIDETQTLDNKYVNVAGDEMTGELGIRKIAPHLHFYKTGTANGAYISTYHDNVLRWRIDLTNGSDNGDNFTIERFADNGTYYGPALQINRTSGTIFVAKQIAFGDNQLDDQRVIFGNFGHWVGRSFATGALHLGGGQSYVQINSANPLKIDNNSNATAIGNGALICSGGGSFNGYLFASDHYAVRNANEGVYFFGSAGARYVHCDGTQFNFAGCPVTVQTATAPGHATRLDQVVPLAGNVTVANGLYFAGNNRYLVTGTGAGSWYDCNAVQNVFVGGENLANHYRVFVSGIGNVMHISTVDGSVNCLRAIRYSALYGAAAEGYAGTNPHICTISISNPNNAAHYIQTIHYPGLWVGFRIANSTALFDFRGDGTAWKAGGGAWSDSSDGRIKTVLGDYTSSLDAVAALRPVRYKYKGNDTFAQPSAFSDHEKTNPDGSVKQAPTKEALTAPYANSSHYAAAVAQKEFIGLVAQEAEVLMPELVNKSKGYIDGTAVTDLRDLDTGPLIFALVNAVKELKARVEQLEGVA